MKIRLRPTPTMVASAMPFSSAAPMCTFAPLTPMIRITEVRIRFCALL